VVSPRDELLARLDALLREAGGDETLLGELAQRAAAALGSARQAAPVEAAWHGLVGTSGPMLELRGLVEKFARVQSPVLVRGESGTGKEVVARALHALSPRAARRMVAENCAAIPANLIESVLFGHVRGAFTGAVKDHEGHFVAADGGTLFLDEIGDMPLAMQAKLLRVLQDGEVRPVGGTAVRKVDVRVIAATNQDLEAMVKQARFREDLLFRLNVLRITTPPLRERGDDILVLARQFLAAATARSGRVLGFSPEAEASMLRAAWPGNVRQLQNEMQRLAALAEGPLVQVADLSPDLGVTKAPDQPAGRSGRLPRGSGRG
jgi:transcriptional regulator with GAF, ATPase, and Fis domain